MRFWKVCLGATCAGAVVLGGNVGPAMADVEVHRVNEYLLKPGFPPPGQDSSNASWYEEDTNSAGDVTLTDEFGAPAGWGSSALKLTTADDTGKAQALTPHDVFNESLLAVNHVSHYTYSDSSSESNQANASIQLPVDTNGLDTTGGFTTRSTSPTTTRPTTRAAGPVAVLPRHQRQLVEHPQDRRRGRPVRGRARCRRSAVRHT